jgi:hypothetical protein
MQAETSTNPKDSPHDIYFVFLEGTTASEPIENTIVIVEASGSSQHETLAAAIHESERQYADGKRSFIGHMRDSVWRAAFHPPHFHPEYCTVQQ